MFTQRDVDTVLHGYVRSSYDSVGVSGTGHALSGLRVEQLSYGELYTTASAKFVVISIELLTVQRDVNVVRLLSDYNQRKRGRESTCRFQEEAKTEYLCYSFIWTCASNANWSVMFVF